MRRSQVVSLVVVVVGTLVAVAGVFAAGWRPLLGLDLQGGVSVVLEPTEETDAERIDQAIEIIRSRVDAIGVAEPDITRQGQNVVVQIPGVDDPQRALELVGKTAELRWRPVLAGPFVLDDPEGRVAAQQTYELFSSSPEVTTGDAEAPDGSTTTTVPGDGSTTTSTGDGSTTTTGDGSTTTTTGDGSTTTTGADEGTSRGLVATNAALLQTTTTAPVGSTPTAPTTTTDGATEGSTTTTTADDTTTTTAPASTTTTEFDPSTAPSIDELLTRPEEDVADATVVLPDRTQTLVYVLGPTELTGEVVDSASADFPGEWVVNITFTDTGAGLFDDLAARYFQQAVAIVLDGIVESAPVFQQPGGYGGQAVISGTFTEDEARDVATALEFGALPVEFEALSTQTVSATLGQDALDAGLLAGLVGLLVVGVYMVAYYRLLGLVAMLSLAVSGGLLWVIIAWLGETRGLALTLAGATGIIVSIGVQVDSNIVYYERIKDDVRRGRSIRSAADGSFAGAYSTIIKADVASLIGAGLLYWLTVGPVRGFALFLGLATLLDLLVSYVFMRPLVVLIARRVPQDAPRLLGLVPPDDAPSTPEPVR